MQTSNAPVYSAKTLDEALRLRADHPEATILAGGTDVMVFLEAGTIHPTSVIDIWGCAGLRGIIEDEASGALQIGALTTWTDIVHHAGVPDALRECARTVGAIQIQNRATVGGNIVNASPAGDSLPLWLAMDAQFEVGSQRGRRMVPAADFWTGYRAVDMAADELLITVHVDGMDRDHLHYRKVGTRLAQAISKVVLGGRIRVEDGVVTEARLALGSVAPVPVRLLSVEAALTGSPIDPSAADKVAQDITPIDDIRSTAHYRSQVATRIVRSWLESLA
jgi:xanthine dehydrogenase small subunit